MRRHAGAKSGQRPAGPEGAPLGAEHVPGVHHGPTHAFTP